MKKLVILCALMVALSASTASAVGVHIRGPGIITCRIVAQVRISGGRLVTQTYILDTNPTTPRPYLAGIFSKDALIPIQVFDAAVGGNLVASGSIHQNAQASVVYNGATWSIVQP